MGSNIDIRIISIAVVIALLVGAGAGYLVGNSPVSSLMEKKDQLEAECDSLYSQIQSVEAELDSTKEIARERIARAQRYNEVLQERITEMLPIEQENQVLTQQAIDLETQISSQSEVIEWRENQLAIHVENSRSLIARLQALLDPAIFPTERQGRLDTWYHYRDVGTEEGDPQYDAKVIDGNWCLIDLDGKLSLTMMWTELNINEEVEGAPPGTYDRFVVTLTSQNIAEDPESFVLSGEAYWQKTNWNGKIGQWTTEEVQIEIMPLNYNYQFRYIQRYGAGNELLILGSFYH